jgi:hypothetical protein
LQQLDKPFIHVVEKRGSVDSFVLKTMSVDVWIAKHMYELESVLEELGIRMEEKQSLRQHKNCIEKIVMYKTTDGQLFDSVVKAHKHQIHKNFFGEVWDWMEKNNTVGEDYRIKCTRDIFRFLVENKAKVLQLYENY